MSAAAVLELRRIYKRQLRKPDGRSLVLYSHAPIDVVSATAPDDGVKFAPNPHLRWHPLRGEWVSYTGCRQNLTFSAPKEYDPLAPTRSAAHPSELPTGDYDVAVFENRFPTFFGGAHDPPRSIVATAAARGVCEIVVYARDASATLGSLPLHHIELVVDVWADRTHELGEREDVSYVHVFENRGAEVGVRLPHPHGQVQAYPFVPPSVARELDEQRAYFERTGRGLLADYVARELADGRRIVYAGSRVVAFVPACARWPYEAWVVPLKPSPRLSDLGARDRADLARALKTVLLKLDGVFRKPMPYVLAIHQAPADGVAHLEAHVHVEIYPALRMANRTKHLAGSELAAGVFSVDTLPEDKAEELRRIEVNLE